MIHEEEVALGLDDRAGHKAHDKVIAVADRPHRQVDGLIGGVVELDELIIREVIARARAVGGVGQTVPPIPVDLADEDISGVDGVALTITLSADILLGVEVRAT